MNLDSINEYFPFIFYISNLSSAGIRKKGFIRKTRKSIYPHRPHFLHFYTKKFFIILQSKKKPSNFCILDLYQQLFSKRKFIHFECYVDIIVIIMMGDERSGCFNQINFTQILIVPSEKIRSNMKIRKLHFYYNKHLVHRYFSWIKF